MTDQHKFSWKRIATFGTTSALVLVTAALIPLVGIRVDAHSDRNEKAHLEHRELYELGLAPCGEMLSQASDGSMRVESNEIDIYILPSFSEAIGVRVSPTGVRRFSHHFWSFYPPPTTLYPPPLPPGEQQVSNFKNIDNPEPPRQWNFETHPEVHLHQLMGEQLFGLLQTEINVANAPWEIGADGIRYFFTDGVNCAQTWSPNPDTRASKLAELANELVSLSGGEPDQTSKVRSNIRRIIIELEYQKRMFGGPELDNIQALSPAPHDGRE